MRIAIVDPASFVLPYVCFLADACAKEGIAVDVFCSATKYNVEFVGDIERLHSGLVVVKKWAISQTAISSRIRGVFNYCRLAVDLIINRSSYDKVFFQFGIFLPVDLFIFIFIRGKLYYFVHDDVPHGFRRRIHLGTLVRSISASRLVFVSNSVKTRFLDGYRYFRLGRKSVVLQHGVLGSRLDAPVPEFRDLDRSSVVPTCFFGNVKDYKGVDFLVEMVEAGTVGDVWILGKWDSELAGLKIRAIVSGCVVCDEYLSVDKMEALFFKPKIYVLPYRKGSQSGVLYLLLYFGLPFICSRTGDLYDFLKRSGLEELAFDFGDSSDFLRAHRYVVSNFVSIRRTLLEIRKTYEWANIIKYSDIVW